jgi:AmmeMemoRadiSam system protein B/AmmeMemoRadiSam system protein A
MNQQFQGQKKNREAAFANTFYPGSKVGLKRKLEELFSEAGERIQETGLRALISPHAGYVFSGKVAASAFNQIPENASYERVFVLASSHQFRFRGAAVFYSGNYETPLGEIEVDKKLARELLESNKIFCKNDDAHIYEHSLEVQLPFLQHRLKNKFLLVPLILGTNNSSDCEKIALALEPWFRPENLFVISSDFSHYPAYQDAVDNDLTTATAICLNKPEELLKVLETNKKKKIPQLVTSLCGWTSVLTLLYLTENKEVTFFKTDYKNSGDSKIFGDKERVVGYWALAVYNRENGFSISPEEQQELLKKARDSISYFIKTGTKANPEPPFSKGVLLQKAGVFVSIYVDEKLRGCIGNFGSDTILNDLVQNMAVSAACDYRFDNLEPEELDKMKLEISVLSPLKKVKNVEEIKPGKHGIYIKKDLNSGTFLPQVATKTGWELEELLGHCSRDKAGLGWDGWKDAEIYTYEAFVFSE